MKLRYILMGALIGLVAGAQAALICQLDATVPGSVVTNGSGVVTDWLDQSGNGNNAGDLPRVGSPLFPSASLSASGLPGVDFTTVNAGYRLFSPTEQDSFLDFTGSASAKSGFAVFAAVKVDGIGGANVRDPVFGNHGNAANANNFILKYEGGQVRAVLAGQTFSKSGGTPVTAGNTLVIAFNYDKATGAFELWDSNNMSSLTNSKAAANFSSTQNMWLGRTENGGQFINGAIGEFLVYDEFLDATTFSNKYTELKDKWAVATGILPPSGVTAAGAFSSVVLDWGDDATGLLDFYTLHRGISSGTYTVTTNLTVSGFTDTDVVDGTEYFYAVTATDTNGNESAFSAEVSATPFAAPSEPGVSVSFSNSIPQASGNNNLGDVTLQFTVDGSGVVTLDASATGASPVGLAAVNAWDGPVGIVSSPSAYNTVFSLLLDDSGEGMKISDLQGGALGVSGQNAWRIDRPGVESISATATIPAGRLELREVDWVNRNSPTTEMLISGPAADYTNTLSTANGTWNISNELVRVENSESLVFGNAIGNGALGEGYGLAGLKFDIIDPAPTPGITVTFANTTISPDSVPTNNVVGLTLDFTIDGAGLVTMDATTTSSIPATVAAVDAWDGPVGFITNAEFFSSSFQMQLSDEGGYGPLGEPGGLTNNVLMLTDNAGGGLGVGGQNAWRVDRNGEEFINLKASSVPVGRIQITAVNWNNRATPNSVMQLNTPNTTLTNVLNAAAGIWTLNSGVDLAQNDVVSFTMPVPLTSGPDGYAVAGFSFDIVGIGQLTYAEWAGTWGVAIGSETDDADLDGLLNLSEYALGGDPTNGTAAPAVLPVLIPVAAGLDYVHVQRNNDTSLVYTVESTTDLVFGSWANADSSVIGTDVLGGLFDTVTNSVSTAADQLFLRLKIEN